MTEERKSRYELFLEDEPRATQPPTTKQCSRCGKDKPIGEYHKASKERLGVAPHCKACECAAYRKSHPRKYTSPEDRFLRKTLVEFTMQYGGCLEWTGEYSGNGHTLPRCTLRRKRESVRRIVYRLCVDRDLPEDMHVMPTCLNHRCVLSSHLKKMTKDEMKAMIFNDMQQVKYSHWGRRRKVRNGDYKDDQKRCNLCKEFKTLNEYFKSDTSLDGRRSYCKVCTYEKRRIYYAAQRDSINAKKRAQRQRK